MAVYEQTYGPYAGTLTPERSRFLVLPRYALRDVFRSKLFTGLFAACFIYPLVAAILVYLHHNVNAIALLQIDVREIVPIDGSFFQYMVVFQGTLAFLLTVIIGPPLVSRDLANNALPLYLCRPFSRAEYVLGKMCVLLFLLSLVTWMPALLVFFLQSYLEGAAWFGANFWMAGSIFVASAAWIIFLSLLSLAVSAWVRWRVVASGAILGLFFIPTAFGQIINNLFLTRVGNLITPGMVFSNITMGLFGRFQRQTGHVRGYVQSGFGEDKYVDIVMLEPPLWMFWLMLVLMCSACLFLLSRKVRAYEVVKS
ncbi:MAG TPA: ABC transporter permease [Pyrinomonadaceae bacterium]|nr:ABC transporter permease [Pyrinomonadaceae bacterium]